MAKPNILLFMMDALRPDRLSPWGHDAVAVGPPHPTPNFARLAETGVFFRNCFSHMPSSHPSRASILTGRDPHTHGVRINSRPLSASETTLTQILRNAGYLTATTRTFPPGMGRGFEERGLVSKVLSPFDAGPWDIVKELPQMAEDEAGTDVAQDTTALIRWLQRYVADPERRKHPFFLWADCEDTHEPWRPPVPYNTMYDPEPYDGPDVSCPPMYSPHLTERQVRHARALYDGVVALEDAHLGRLLDALERLGLAQDTLLIVMSDHGVHLGENHLWRKPPTLFDAVLRATLIMRLPGVIPQGRHTDGLNLVNDVFATVLDLAELEMPSGAVGQCTSLRPLWEGQQQVRNFVPLEFNLYKGTAGKGIRTERWKYFYYRSVGDLMWDTMSPADVWRGEGWPLTMLFDLENDPAESRNVADEFPQVEREMRDILLNWLIDSENDLPAPVPGD
ncbi:MAG TPA: sulfatase-like hydrolase/transferase [Candidatus Latescibacteria bacterium]|nr:sulfatase-like hydrolase/transferase [Candidatus Latescibacterota bacterium]